MTIRQWKLIDEIPEELQIQLHVEILSLRQELHHSMELSQWSELREIAHQLCGLISLYGLEALQNSAQSLESAAQKKRPAEIRDSIMRLSRLIDALPSPHHE